ncbi:MAG: bifunctional 4-hydroxy-3-methylbut-2-enyl diphosphate reductase/30S ribosomal protein S1, partial [Pseudoflavonifractor sp.]|nr:bifunctional 4-hydroxy-3-methylbut-2-enyl diphosphate reductase/30S ribosomal protein S1 [Pseudoflavonifractor sp.]
VMLGPVIHNRSVIRQLQEQQVEVVERPEDVPGGAVVILRSHGEGALVHQQLLERGIQAVDTTCPNVSRIHKLVAQAGAEGRQVIIIGAPGHPEVRAIAGWCAAPLIFQDGTALEQYLRDHAEIAQRPVTMVSQTTSTQAVWNICVENAKKLCTNIKIFDTICNATYARQSEAQKLAAQNDAVIVIGGRDSANTRRLFELCTALCPHTVWVENADELASSDFRECSSVAITAGASTPAWIIKEVYDKMSEENMEIEESFAELLEKSIKTLHTGEKVTGVVTDITPTEIYVDLGTKHAGYIPVSELTDDPTVKVEDLVHVGDSIETYVMRVNDAEGVVTLSKKRLDTVKSWDDVEQACENHTTVEGVVTEENKGGVVVSIKGVRVFVPASQTGLPRDAAMSELVKQKVKLRITEVNRARRRVVGSIRAVSAAERAEKAAEVWNEIAEGKHYHGVVKSLTSYGAFVDIGGVDGMVHISELSWSRIKHPSEVVNPGDEVDVYVISFDPEKKKISLGMKDHGQDPWANFTEQCHVGDTANVRVVKLMTFGAFAEVVPGVDGLIHISQIADHRIDKPGDVLHEGDRVDVKITDIDYDRKKVSLSIRALLEDGQAASDDEEPAQD